MRDRTRGAAAAACCAGVLAALLAAGSGVPLYDGVGFPDEPYRYVVPPPGSPRTPPPTTGVAVSPVRRGLNTDEMVAASDEQGSQVAVYLPTGAVSYGADASGTLRLIAAPRAPAGLPAGVVADGNAYLVTLGYAGTPTLTAAAGSGRVTLRDASKRPPQPVLEYRPGPAQPWQPLATDQVGADIYGSGFSGPGQYVLAQRGAAATRHAAHRSALPWVIGGAVVLLLAVLAGLRLVGRERA